MDVKYIFCISTGRSGTGYLASLLKCLKSSSVFHEHKPILNGLPMQEYLKGNFELMQTEIPKKIEVIKNFKENIYIDTSHLFIKGFGWEIPKYINQEEIGIIILKRDRKKVVDSTMKVHSGPFSYFGRKWIITPRRKNIVHPPIRYNHYILYYLLLKFFWILIGKNKTIKKVYPSYFKKISKKLLYWYIDETEALCQKYMIKFDRIKYVEVNLEDLNNFEGVIKIADAFDLSKSFNQECLKHKLGKFINEKKHFKA